MYRVTKDSMWRDRCYGIYQGIEKHSRTEIGYAAVKGIDFDVEVVDEADAMPILPATPDGERPPHVKWTKWARLEDNMPRLVTCFFRRRF